MGRSMSAAVPGGGRATPRHLVPLFLLRSQGHFPEGRPGETSPLITENPPSFLLWEYSRATLRLAGAQASA